jgi:hypothetical protein
MCIHTYIHIRPLHIGTDAIDHYATCGLVKHIYIVWSEKNGPPEKIVKKYANSAHPLVDFCIYIYTCIYGYIHIYM